MRALCGNAAATACPLILPSRPWFCQVQSVTAFRGVTPEFAALFSGMLWRRRGSSDNFVEMYGRRRHFFVCFSTCGLHLMSRRAVPCAVHFLSSSGRNSCFHHPCASSTVYNCCFVGSPSDHPLCFISVPMCDRWGWNGMSCHEGRGGEESQSLVYLMVSWYPQSGRER